MSEETWFYDRRQGRLEQEVILGDRLLRLAYLSGWRGLLRWPLFGCSLCSRLLGCFADSRLSRSRIEPTIKQLGIDLSEVEVPDGGFQTFNAFFCRQLKPGARPLAPDPRRLLSPADSRALFWPELQDGQCIPAKGASFSVEELLGAPGAEYAPRFRNGALAVFRLCPADYHRYHFPADGRMLRSWRLRGKYHSVHPLALATRLRVFSENLRVVSMLDFGSGGLAAFIEVGAFGVASIRQTFSGSEFRRGLEKGFFAFGGSTIILLLEPGRWRFDEDLLTQSAQGRECLLRMGEGIADRND
ncbi:MAG: phosphatidylserine decarboxylase [Lentisphaerae bacterium]|nr:phosphatidylserine decarboxylase [Lentisphaerota bacterium]